MDLAEENEFKLEPDEEYDKFCGKVFLTTKRNIIVHCVLCLTKYQGFESFMNHIENEHFTDESDESFDEKYLESEEDETFYSMHEEELPIKLLQNKIQINVHPEASKDVNQHPNIAKNGANKSSERVDINAIDEELPTEVEDRSRRTQIITSDKGVLTCPHCPQRFLLDYALRAHVKEHDANRQKFKCKICGVLCKSKALLRQHIRRHAVHKPNKCTECERSFVHPSELQYHMRNHNGEKPFQCEDCGVRFAYKSTLRMHRKRQHTFQKDYSCAICNQAFYSTRSLRDHMYKHTNEATYKCDKCHKEISSYSSYKLHMSKHRERQEAEKKNSE